ncbi:MAG: hypothetical protein AB1921_06195 [Thermodesulfobacteriota bacterium]
MSPARLHLESRYVDLALKFLIGLDAVLAIIAYALPGVWFWIFHGAPYTDPQGLLQRAAGSFLAFLLIQLAALLLWKKRPEMLAVVAGVRFSDVFTDWSCLVFATDMTGPGKVLFVFAGLANLACGIFFLYAFYSRQSGALKNGDAEG